MTFLPIMLVLCTCIASAKLTQDRGEVWKNNKRIFSAKQPHRILIRLAVNRSRLWWLAPYQTLRRFAINQSTLTQLVDNQSPLRQLVDNQSPLTQLVDNQSPLTQLVDNQSPFHLSAFKQPFRKNHGRNGERQISKDVYQGDKSVANYKR